MGSPATKLKKLAITDRKDLENHIKRIGTLGREIAALQAEVDAEAAKVIRPFLKKIARRRQALRVLDADAVAFCEVFRDDLLSSAKGKTAQLATGTVQYKAGRSKVVFEMQEDLVIAHLHEAGHDDAIRVKHSVDKSFVLGHPEIADDVKGLSVQEGTDTIIIKPTSIS